MQKIWKLTPYMEAYTHGNIAFAAQRAQNQGGKQYLNHTDKRNQQNINHFKLVKQNDLNTASIHLKKSTVGPPQTRELS